MPAFFSDTELTATQDGRLGIMTLNRPAALNALSLEMIRIITANLMIWAEDDSVSTVLFLGAGDRAFCAGGDVKAAHNAGMQYRRGDAAESVISLYFEEEYALNRLLKSYPKPLVAYMDGITMGGGFGVAGPCRYRIVTEKTRFAMPEVSIGLFPDVGGVWFLSRAPGEAGAYLTLTGNTVGPADAMFAGIGTHYLPRDMAAALINALKDTDDVGAALDALAIPQPDSGSLLMEYAGVIDACFAMGTVEDILTALRMYDSPWSRQTADIIESRSPVSLKVSLAHLRRSRDMDFDAITAQDLILAHNFMKGHDFYEGVRAMVINKDKQPQWDPARLADVDEAMVNHYFIDSALIKNDFKS